MSYKCININLTPIAVSYCVNMSIWLKLMCPYITSSKVAFTATGKRVFQVEDACGGFLVMDEDT